MPKRMKWNQPRADRETETKYQNGTVLRNGMVVRNRVDGMAARAQKAEREWLQANRMGSIFDRPPSQRKKQKKRHCKPLGCFEDVTMAVLDQMDEVR